MKLLSLGSYLNSTEERMRELMALLISGIRLHAVGQDESRRRDFQSELARIEGEFPVTQKVEEISLLVGQAIQCIDSYHRWVDSDIQIASSEFKQLAVSLTQTVGRMAAGNEDSLEKLRSIEKQMSAVNSVADIRLLRHDLSSCRTDLCEKTVQYREEATRLVSTLQNRLQTDPTPRLQDLDSRIQAGSAAGLAGRTAAMDSIRQALQAHVCSFAVALLIDRFPLMAKRFGVTVIDQLQTIVSMEIAQKLRPADQMFEWTPGGFVIIMERTEPIERVKSHMKQLSTIKQGKVIEMDNRSVVLPASMSFCVLPLFQAPSAEAVEKDIDAFVNAHI